jgi:hypothetical protein
MIDRQQVGCRINFKKYLNQKNKKEGFSYTGG